MKKISIILCLFASISCSRDYAQTRSNSGLCHLPEIDLPKIEAINTTEDMIEWMYYDCQQGYIDSNIAGAYIQNYYEILNYLQTKK